MAEMELKVGSVYKIADPSKCMFPESTLRLRKAIVDLSADGTQVAYRYYFAETPDRWFLNVAKVERFSDNAVEVDGEDN